MNTDAKINQLLVKIPKDAILLSSWLSSQGYPYELQQRYRTSGWLNSIGRGAMVRPGTTLKITAAIAALQQSGVTIHIGGRTALGIMGQAHYIEMDAKRTILFTDANLRLPEWLLNNEWDTEPILYRSGIISGNLGLVEHYDGEIRVMISSPARAIMECLSLSPDKFDLQEAYEIMEGLTTLRPVVVQQLLENCKSIKVNRLFLWFAEKTQHSWLKHINTDKIKLGSGKRSIVNQGMLTPKYDLVLPETLARSLKLLI